jgi:hypothetical protein
MEWILLFPLLFFLPAAVALWKRRRIGAGAEVEVRFDMELPSKWAAELTQRALQAEGVRARVWSEAQSWLCSVTRQMKYDTERVDKAVKHFEQVANARGGGCLRYVLKRGDREEVHHCEASDALII